MTGQYTESAGVTIEYSVLWAEVQNWRSCQFSWSKALTAILLRLAPSIWDIVSDYTYAGIWADETYYFNLRALVYFFISLPVLMLVLPVLEHLLKTLAISVFSKRQAAEYGSNSSATASFSYLSVGLLQQ
jgi:hypothetical protein